MNANRSQLFEELDPPPGGVDRLRERLRSRENQPWVRHHWRPAAAFTLVVVVAVISLIRMTPEPVDVELALYQASEFDRLLGRAPQRIELSVERNQQGVDIVEVASSDPKIRIYELN